MTRAVLRVLGIGLLYLLASPVFLVLGIRRLQKLQQLHRALAAGAVTCPSCGYRNALAALARCRRCGFAEYATRLRCSACGQTTKAIDCASCQASIRVW